MTAVIRRLLHSRDLILKSQMVYLIVDNRMPAEVTHWPAVASWWSSRRNLVGPQGEVIEVLWICADKESGLHDVPYYWAGVFVLEAARTLFESQDLFALAERQHQWPDLVGHDRANKAVTSKVGMLLFTEAHLEYNAGLVLSFGSAQRVSPVRPMSTAESLACELLDYRKSLLATARPLVIQAIPHGMDSCSLPCLGCP